MAAAVADAETRWSPLESLNGLVPESHRVARAVADLTDRVNANEAKEAKAEPSGSSMEVR